MATDLHVTYRYPFPFLAGTNAGIVTLNDGDDNDDELKRLIIAIKQNTYMLPLKCVISIFLRTAWNFCISNERFN
jgi:uncharacterized protein YybS (DUF2232 family)